MKRRKLEDGVLRVGLLGLGTVGSGVAEILSRHAGLIGQRAGVQLEIVRALVRKKRKRLGAAGAVPVTTKPQDVVQAPDVDIVVELLGGHQPALGLMHQALAAGKPVITANKAVLARHGTELFVAAARSQVDVYFEGAVAGGIPIIRTLREGLAGDRIASMRGILNGTTNYILSCLAEGASYADALVQAQHLGFAEADPTLDVNGGDAADKLAILIQLAFGTRVLPDKLPTEGITSLTPDVLADADELGYRVKLLGIAQRVRRGGTDVLDARVHPAMVPRDHVLSHVPANQNAIAVHSEALGSTLYQGAGAGSLPTGTAVVADLVEAARNMRAGVSGRLQISGQKTAPKLIKPAEAVSAYYLRLLVDDKPGVLGTVANILATQHISMASVLQRERGSGPVPLVITTHTTPQGAMQKSLARMARLKALHGRVHVLRIETTA